MMPPAVCVSLFAIVVVALVMVGIYLVWRWYSNHFGKIADPESQKSYHHRQDNRPSNEPRRGRFCHLAQETYSSHGTRYSRHENRLTQNDQYTAGLQAIRHEARLSVLAESPSRHDQYPPRHPDPIICSRDEGNTRIPMAEVGGNQLRRNQEPCSSAQILNEHFLYGRENHRSENHLPSRTSQRTFLNARPDPSPRVPLAEMDTNRSTLHQGTPFSARVCNEHSSHRTQNPCPENNLLPQNSQRTSSNTKPDPTSHVPLAELDANRPRHNQETYSSARISNEQSRHGAQIPRPENTPQRTPHRPRPSSDITDGYRSRHDERPHEFLVKVDDNHNFLVRIDNHNDRLSTGARLTGAQVPPYASSGRL